MKRVLFAALLLAACSGDVRDQQTPEPHETARVESLIVQLGRERTYNSQTLAVNPDPDGLVFMRWLDRRKATLVGTLAKHQLPASFNPGTITATLAWERKTEKAEGKAARERRDACGEHPCPIEPPADPEWTPLEGENNLTE